MGHLMSYFIVLPATIMLFAVGLLYLSNKHQLLRVKPLTKKLRPIAYLMLLFAFVLMAAKYAVSASLFIGLMVIMLCVIALPLMALFLKGNKT